MQTDRKTKGQTDKPISRKEGGKEGKKDPLRQGGKIIKGKGNFDPALPDTLGIPGVGYPVKLSGRIPKAKKSRISDLSLHFQSGVILISLLIVELLGLSLIFTNVDTIKYSFRYLCTDSVLLVSL